MALTAENLIVDAAGQYNDELQDDNDYERIKVSKWIQYLNSGLRSVVLVRPDSSPKRAPVLLVSGTHQDLPSEAFRFISITRNMGSDGLTPGRVITPIDTEMLNLTNQLWHTATSKTYIDHYMYDDENSRSYMVTPPVTDATPVYVEMEYSYLPTTITDISDPIVIADVFANPIIEWMLYQAFTVDDEEVNFQKGMAHLQTFFNLLQVEFQSGLLISPTKDE